MVGVGLRGFSSARVSVGPRANGGTAEGSVAFRLRSGLGDRKGEGDDEGKGEDRESVLRYNGPPG